MDGSAIDDGESIDVGGAGGAAAPKADAAPRSFKDAMAAVRAELGKGKPAANGDAGAAGEGGEGGDGAGGEGGEGGAPAETDEAFETRIAELAPEEQTAERDARDAVARGEPDPRFLVELAPLREGAEPIRFVTESQEDADAIRHLQRRAASGESALRIREQAEAIRAQADEARYQVEVDPASFIAENLTDPADASTLARFFLTRPGVLEALNAKGWLTAILGAPEAIEHEGIVADAQMVKRREKVAPLVEARRFENQNARACVRRAYEAIDAAVPADFTDDQRNRIVSYVVRDLQEIQRAENVRVTDPKRVPQIVGEVLKSFGVAPGAKKAPAGGGNGRGPAKPGARPGPSGQDLRATADARRRAAGPGPGAGSPAAAIPKLGKGKEGETSSERWKRGFDHIRSAIRTLRRSPS